MLPTLSPPQHPRQTSPSRGILREQSRSQANKLPQRWAPAEVKQEPHVSTPYPTKPAHVLLPNSRSYWEEGSSGSLEAFFAARSVKEKRKIAGDENRLEIPGASNAKALGSKRSVSELRGLYESQAPMPTSTSRSTNHSSGPSTAVSSPAWRGQMLGERLSEKGKSLTSVSDERIALPPLREATWSIKKISSENSLPPPPATPPDPSLSDVDFFNDSSSAWRTHLVASSPKLTALGSSPSGSAGTIGHSSSPNFVSLGHSSSQDFSSEPPTSSPNIIPLRLSSSSMRNFVPSSSPGASQREQSFSWRGESPAASSSPNVVVLRSSSPNYVTTKYDDVRDISPASLRTIKRRPSELLEEQPSVSSLSTPPERLSSSPPNQVKSATSASTLDFSLASGHERESPATQQNGRLQTHEDLQSAIESSPAPEIQYPVVPAPKTNRWEELNVPKRPRRLLPQGFSSTEWDLPLPAVPSKSSDKDRLSSFHTIDTADNSDAQSISEMPQPLYTQDPNFTSSTTSIVPEADRREATDVVSHLRDQYLHSKSSGFLSLLSESSQSDSIGSFVPRRPSSSSSLKSTVRFPAWVHRYYSRGPGDSVYTLRPETASSNFSHTSRSPAAVPPADGRAISGLFRSRARASKNPRESHLLPGIGPLVSNPSQLRLSPLALDPADPRSHWAGAERAAVEAESHSRPAVGSHLANEWSPHLFPDNRTTGRNTWLAPSIDESSAPIFTWRNAHVVGFMLGFIFPISWFVAAVLPLPPRPAMKEISHDPEAGGPALQEQLDYRAAVTEEIEYANLRWWRNLNRFMCAVGLVVVAVIITLSVIGTRRGFGNA